jgi:predicted metal-dependent phosphoesterase TrpH
VTDHDTLAGLAEATEEAKRRGLELIGGVELSAFAGTNEVHILGHFVSPSDPVLGRFSELLRTERRDRMEKMVAKMQGLGFPISMADVLAIAGQAQLGRPHLAQVLVQKGYCLTTKEAFDRFLGSGRAAFVDRYRLSSEEAIRMIRGAGGAATIAHPGVSKIDRHDVETMKAQGLSGLEVYHSDHNPSVREKYLAIAKALDLVPTAGSDYHGPTVTPGRSFGPTEMTPALLEALRQRATGTSAS